jgi:hypothetical protein
MSGQCHGVLRLHDLKYACDRLYEYCEYQNQSGNPELPPLHRFPIISPPLKWAFWLMAIIRSFEFHEAISPVLEVLDLAKEPRLGSRKSYRGYRDAAQDICPQGVNR